MANFQGKFESAKQEWETPQDLFDRLDRLYHFTFDLAADSTNAKCERFFTEEDDSLTQPWEGSCWLNPPYGAKAKLSTWVKKAYEETRSHGTRVVMLIPARTNTNWWHQYVMAAREILLIRGRPRFGGADHGLPQPLAIVVFERTPEPTRWGSFDATKKCPCPDTTETSL